MKKFTLIELITIIIVISILAAIVVVSIQDVRDNAIRASVSSNVRNFETVRDIKITKDNEFNLSEIKPILGNPQVLDIDSLIKEDIKNKPKHGIYWIDSFETIYGSIVDLPIVEQVDNHYNWEYIKNSKMINVYKVTPTKKLKLVDTLDKSTTSFNGDSGAIYLFSYIDKLGLETAPVGIYEEGEPKICTFSLSAYRFEHNKEKHEEFLVRNNLYNSTHKDNNNNIISLNIVKPINSANSGDYLTINLYNKDFEILKNKVVQLNSRSYSSSQFVPYYFENLSNGDYVFVVLHDNRYSIVFRLNKELQLIYWEEIVLPERGYGLETIEVLKINNDELLIAGNVDFNSPKLVKFDVNKGETVNIASIPKLEYSLSYRDERIHDLTELSNGEFAINTSTVFGNHYFKRKLIYNENLELINEINTRGRNGYSTYGFGDTIVDYDGFIYSYEEDYPLYKINKYDYELNLIETYPFGSFYPNISHFDYETGTFYFLEYNGKKEFNVNEKAFKDTTEAFRVKTLFTIGDYTYVENEYYGTFRFKNSTIETLTEDYYYELDIPELEMPNTIKHLPINLYEAYDLLDKYEPFDLMRNYQQKPINNGGNPYYPTGQAIIEGVEKEILSLQQEYSYYEDYLDYSEEYDSYSLKEGFKDTLIIAYDKDEDKFIGFVTLDSKGNQDYSSDFNELSLEEYQSAKSILINAFWHEYNEDYTKRTDYDRMYLVKGNAPSSLVVSGKEKIGFTPLEEPQNQKSEGPHPYDVDPCYAGAYMFKADNVSVIYKVDKEGKLIPYAKMDDFVNSIDNFKYGGSFDTIKPLHPYNDVIFYYLPNGSIVDSLKTRIHTYE